MQLWWIVHKDLLTEWRARQIVPAVMLLGIVVGFLFTMQTQVVPSALVDLAGSQYWLTVFLGSVLILDGSFETEREVERGSALRLYAVEPCTIFLAKLAGNAISLGMLQLALVVLFSLLAGTDFRQNSGRLLLVGCLGNLAMTSVGTLLGAIASGLRRGRGLLTVLLLPLQIPIVIAAAEATRTLLAGHDDPGWWLWVQLLGASALMFVTAGAVLYEYVIES